MFSKTQTHVFSYQRVCHQFFTTPHGKLTHLPTRTKESVSETANMRLLPRKEWRPALSSRWLIISLLHRETTALGHSIILKLMHPYHTIPYHTIPYNNIPYHILPYNIIPYHTIPYVPCGLEWLLSHWLHWYCLSNLEWLLWHCIEMFDNWKSCPGGGSTLYIY